MSLSKITKSIITFAVASAASLTAHAEVVTSIRPLEFVAAAIADGVEPTSSIVPAGASPHDFSLSPKDLKKIKEADLVVWIGHEDAFLSKSLKNISEYKQVKIANINSLDKLLETGHHHHHHHGAHKHHSHDEELSTNWHIWLSPKIMGLTAEEIAHKLQAIYPDKKDKIAQNLKQFKSDLKQKNSDIKQQLKQVQNKGYYVFHDAYTYFNNQYGLNQLGYFTVNPLVSPGAKKIAEIKSSIQEKNAQCLFAEPQFTPKLVATLAKKTGVKVGSLDPVGAEIKITKHAYPDFLQNLADSFYSCLK